MFCASFVIIPYMTYLLLVIILLLIYIAFFTPEKINQREIKRVQKVFNAPVKKPTNFDINDPRNESHPDEMVSFKQGLTHRKLAVMLYKLEKELEEK